MKCLRWILFMCIIVASGQVVPQNPLEKNIFNFLKKLRAGATVVGVPVPLLKSVKIPPVAYYYDGRGLNLNYSIGEMLVTGLDRFIIENINASVNTLDISVTLRFPVLNLVSDNYKLDGWAYYFYPLSGSGKMKMVFRNSLITAKTHFVKIKDVAMAMEDFVLMFDVKKIETYLENSSWPINAILNNEGVQILEEYRSTIADALKNYVVPAINDYLAKIPPTQLMQIAT